MVSCAFQTFTTAADSRRDNDQTLEQNYKRLGLSTRLNSSAGGPRKIKGKSLPVATGPTKDSLAIGSGKAQVAAVQEVEVERDPDTGKIIRVIRSDAAANSNPLNDPLNDLSEDEENEEEFEGLADDNIVAQLEAQVAQEAEFEAKRKRPRQQSEREQDWLSKLVEVYGENTAAMARDRKLNPMQQSEGDLKRRLKKWKQKHG